MNMKINTGTYFGNDWRVLPSVQVLFVGESEMM
jgi:hypothetical protein